MYYDKYICIEIMYTVYRIQHTHVLSFSKQRGTSPHRAGLNFHTTIPKYISIGSS